MQNVVALCRHCVAVSKHCLRLCPSRWLRVIELSLPHCVTVLPKSLALRQTEWAYIWTVTTIFGSALGYGVPLSGRGRSHVT